MLTRTAPGRSGATPGYSWEVILDRANAWADAHGYPRLTRDTLIEFRRDGFVPGPDRGGRGDGGGRGAAWNWSAPAYRRVLRLLKLRAVGVTSRRLQRSILFAGGAALDIARVRTDLRRTFERDTARINREYGTDFITPSSPTPRKLRDEVEYLLDPKFLEEFLGSVAIGFSDDIKDAASQLIADPAAARVIELALRQTVLPAPGNTLPALRQSVGALPSAVARILAPELDEMSATITGLLAHPDAGNAILEALDGLTDRDLTIMRDYALTWPDLTLAMAQLIRAMPEDPEAAALVPLATIIASFSARMSPRDRLGLLGFFIARTRAVPGFLEAAERTVRMKVAGVLRQIVRRRLLRPDVKPEEMDGALAEAGVPIDAWDLWHG